MRQVMLSVRVVFAVSAGFLLFSAAHAATSPIGVTPGSFSVDGNGGANYTIPIAISPGTAGMVPQLALTYNRQVQSGILGTGWSVSGLSIIQRCGRTIVLDGVKGGVNYDGNDRFCLDGQRLVAINNGAYGANGTEYRTEREAFSKIVSYRDAAFAGSGPQYFKIWTKSGQILEYGATNDSRIEAQGKATVRLWALNKVQDRAGNYFTISYFEDNANGEYRPTRIDYTGNSAASLTPYNSVRFVYETTNRPDVTIRYEGGSVIKSTRRLANLQAYADNTIVRDYKLTHDNNGPVGRSRLASVQECGSDGVCLNSTVPDWTVGWHQTGGTPYSMKTYTDSAGGVDSSHLWLTGDFNGDGLTDLVRRSTDPTDNLILFGHVSGGWIMKNYTDSFTGTMWLTGDFNGDGLTDLVRRSNDPTDNVILLANGNGGWSARTHTDSATGVDSSHLWLTGDFNGDGLTDLVRRCGTDSTDNLILLANGSGGWIMKTYTDSAGGVDSSHLWLAGDFNGDGLTDLVRRSATDPTNNLKLLTNGSVPDRLQTLTTGLDTTSSNNNYSSRLGITYKPLTNSTVYSKDSSGTYPYQNLQGPTYVVSRYTVSDGLGGEHGTSYKYVGAKAHLKGGGWLGFRSITVTDERTGTQTTTEYSQDYAAGTHGLTLRSESRINGVLTSTVDNFWSTRTFTSGPQKLARLDGTLSQKFELDGSPISCAQINTSYDDFGNATQSISKTDTNCSLANAFTKTTAATYNNDETNWRLGQVLRSQTVNDAPGQPSVTRTVAYEYSTTTGQLTSDIIEPDQSAFRVTSRYSYDSFGNRTGTEVSGTGFVTRSSTTTFDSRGQFPVSSANALGHTETRVFDPKWGAVTSTTGPNNLTTTFEYDGFGRLVRKIAADGSTVTTSLAECDASCPPLARYRVISEATGVPPSTAYVDILGRTIRARGQAFDGQPVYQDTEYDSLGRVARSSSPYYGGAIPLWTTYRYDAAGRVKTVTAPDSSTVTTTYAGLQSSITNALNQTSSVRKNAADQAVETTDAVGNKTFFTYDAVGNVVRVVDAAGNTVLTADYDLRGRKTAMVDADSGARAFNYNALGELLSETDAKGQVTSVTYDILGRIKIRTNLEGTSTWTYDTQPKGIGKLATVAGAGYGETHVYDALGRETSIQTVINGTAYTVSTTYDALGRPETVTYPTGFKTRNVYDVNSALIEVRDGSNDALYWKVNTRNERGQLLRHTLGNGITTDLAYDPLTGALAAVRAADGAVQSLDYGFDTLGNLVSRTDNTQGYTETFSYDGLNRLTGVNGPSLKSYQYDAIGNITYKSDVGTYAYHPTKVHAVASTSGTLSASFTYDANGNMTGGAGRSITYTSFNKPAQITANGITTSFTYSPQFGRMVKSNLNGETVYLGKMYERVTQGAGVTHRHYVASPAGLVAIVSQGAVNNVRYLHGDHLGSTSAITDETGNVVERLSFDPFGARRQPNGQDAVGPIASLTPRGYTGHEQDDESRLINMNAREYDPVLGRFLQPDAVADGFGGQGMNRYSYVHNNPLSATDPSGNWKWPRLKDVLKYGPLAAPALPLIFNPVTLSPEALTFKAIENYIRVEYHEPYLLEHPKLIPVAKAVISTVICIFTCEFDFGATTAMFSGLYDARFTYLMGGDRTDVWHAFNRAYISTGLTSAVGTWVGGSAWSSGFGKAGERVISAAVVKGVAGGAAAEIQGGEFGSGFWTGFGVSMAESVYKQSVGSEKGCPKCADRDPTWRLGKGSSTKATGVSVFDPDLNNVGLKVLRGEQVGSLASIVVEGGPVSSLANMVPGINATGVLHDVWSGWAGAWFPVTNIPTMPVAAVVTYGGLLGLTGTLPLVVGFDAYEQY